MARNKTKRLKIPCPYCGGNWLLRVTRWEHNGDFFIVSRECDNCESYSGTLIQEEYVDGLAKYLENKWNNQKEW